MPGGQERILRRRIRSIQSTQKITRAQELIAASRIARAQAHVAAAQPYSDAITQVVHDLATTGGAGDSLLLAPRPELRKVAYVVVTADRGLCGAYNSSVIRAAEQAISQRRSEGIDYELVLVGRKAEGYFRYRDYRIAAAFTGFSDRPSYENARPVGGAATELFLEGGVDLVEVVYTRFVSVGTQVVERERLMPLSSAELAVDDDGTVRAAYEFEPSPEGILDLLLPRYVDARVFAALLNGAASEHAARQRAMKAATDNAEDLITNLTRYMNRARQDAITTEIMEIVGGAEALRTGGARPDDLLADTIEGREADLFAAHTADN
ncbi:MAG TPA: F0F1 ATP synthase subunit gamma [Acidimicrobiia bacterium]|nr:F0F1 ATP synthase subunit gamma [Acidimicrobiia bacterium]